MHKLCLLFAFAILSQATLGFRIKRQSEGNVQELDDRFGWNGAGRFRNQRQLAWQQSQSPQGGWGYPGNQWSYPAPQYPANFPWQFPGPNQTPGQYPGQQFPVQQFPVQQYPVQQFPGQPFSGQQFPGQQFPGQQYPGQQFSGQDLGQGQIPDQGQNAGQAQNPEESTDLSQTTEATADGGSTTESIVLQDCRRSCLVTPEYNPVCGSNNVTYDNPGRLLCDQACGIVVTQTRASRCPAAAVAPVS